MYLGELNPRRQREQLDHERHAVAYGDMPLFLFHLLEFMDVDYEIDVDELNAAVGAPRPPSTSGRSSSSSRPRTRWS